MKLLESRSRLREKGSKASSCKGGSYRGGRSRDEIRLRRKAEMG
jgi:hypothetical protein